MRHAFLCIQSGYVADPEERLQVLLSCRPQFQFIFEYLRCELLKTLVRLYRGLQTPDYVQVLLSFCSIVVKLNTYAVSRCASVSSSWKSRWKWQTSLKSLAGAPLPMPLWLTRCLALLITLFDPLDLTDLLVHRSPLICMSRLPSSSSQGWILPYDILVLSKLCIAGTESLHLGC